MEAIFKTMTKEEQLNDYTMEQLNDAKEQIKAGAKAVRLTRYREDNSATTTRYTAVMMLADNANTTDVLNAIEYNNFGGSVVVKNNREDGTTEVQAVVYID